MKIRINLASFILILFIIFFSTQIFMCLHNNIVAYDLLNYHQDEIIKIILNNNNKNILVDNKLYFNYLINLATTIEETGLPTITKRRGDLLYNFIILKYDILFPNDKQVTIKLTYDKRFDIICGYRYYNTTYYEFSTKDKKKIIQLKKVANYYNSN